MRLIPLILFGLICLQRGIHGFRTTYPRTAGTFICNHCHNQQKSSAVLTPFYNRRENILSGCQKRHIQENSQAVLNLKKSGCTEDDNITSGENVRGPFLFLLLSQFLLFIGVGAVIPSIPLYGKELGFSSAANGVIIAVPSVALLFLSKVGGNFADQARKPAMILGMAIIAISDLGTALASNFSMLVVARLGLGAGRCISESGERGMLADLANQTPELRGRALAAQQACAALGIAIGAPLGGLIVENYGPRAAFLCVTAAATISMIMYFFLPETTEMKFNDVQQTKTSGRAEDREFLQGTNDELQWGKLLKQNKWKGMALCQSGASFGFAAKISSIPVLAAQFLPGGAAAAGSLISIAGISGLVGAPLGGLLTDRVGAKTVAILSGLISAISLILIPIALGADFEDGGPSQALGEVVLGPNAIAFALAVISWSIGAAAQSPALIALAQEAAPKGGEATALALPKAFGDGTYIAVPFILGLVTDSNTEVPGVECAVAGTAVLMGIASLALSNFDD